MTSGIFVFGAGLGLGLWLADDEPKEAPPAKVGVTAPAASAVASTRADSAFIGLEVKGINERVSEALGIERKQGAIVANVALGSPANGAGFERGDVILTFAGKDVASFESLLAIVSALNAGDKVPVTVMRRGEVVKLTLDTKKRPDSWAVTKDSAAVIPGLGITLAAATPKVREGFGLRWGTTGVVVTLTDVVEARTHDLTRGDLIVQVNQEDVWTPEQVVEKFAKAKASQRKDLLLLVEGPAGFRLSLLPVR